LQQSETAESSAKSGRKIFISHASDDEKIAKAFADLIADATGGLVEVVYSSSKDEGSGIDYGADWFEWIRSQISTSDYVIALLTPTSVNRAWILYEGGLGAAASDCQVFGVQIGVSAQDAFAGPFRAFQNSSLEEEQVVKLLKQISRDVARPREERLKTLAIEFRRNIDAIQALPKPRAQRGQAEVVIEALNEMKDLYARSVSHLSSGVPVRRSVQEVAFDVNSVCNALKNDKVACLSALSGLMNASGFYAIAAVLASQLPEEDGAFDLEKLYGRLRAAAQTIADRRLVSTIVEELVPGARLAARQMMDSAIEGPSGFSPPPGASRPARRRVSRVAPDKRQDNEA
jgi:hypothetical protein